MITTVTNDRVYSFRGLSTDTKPTIYAEHTVGNGSLFFEIDTTKVFMFDEANKVWYEI